MKSAFPYLVAAVTFPLVCGQAPLYYSNQNQYFLHGLAQAGVGHLSEDWLAGTLDPTPVFSALVVFTIRFLHPWVFHFFYAVIQGTYAAALLGLSFVVAGEPVRRRWPIFLALFLAVHAALVRWASYRWLGQDYPWYLQSGVAGQYLLGAMFQPSTFGVLLIVAVWLFALDRPFLAAGCAALAATLHSTYLLHAGMLVLGFLAALVDEGRLRRAVGAGVLALVLVLPVTLYVLHTFAPSSASDFAAAQSVLVNLRIPHHARIDLWLDLVAGLQLIWMVLGLDLVRPRRLIIALTVPMALAMVLSLAQVLTRNNTLALLFPWRLSAVLVPIATAVILARLTAVLPHRIEGQAARLASAAVIVACLVGGVWISFARLGFRTSDEELPLMDFVRRTVQPGEVYFLPVNVPDLARTVRGSQSSDFKPLAEKKQGTQVIPIDLQRFRLHAGAAIHVDFKSIPYKDVEVLEWRQRIDWARLMQDGLAAGLVSGVVAELRSRGITHIVRPASQPLRGEGIIRVYQDEYYLLYRLSEP